MQQCMSNHDKGLIICLKLIFITAKKIPFLRIYGRVFVMLTEQILQGIIPYNIGVIWDRRFLRWPTIYRGFSSKFLKIIYVLFLAEYFVLFLKELQYIQHKLRHLHFKPCSGKKIQEKYFQKLPLGYEHYLYIFYSIRIIFNRKNIFL